MSMEERATEIEITERSPLAHLAKHGSIVRKPIIRSKSGFDDFGTGYSALHGLIKLLIDKPKVDSSFIAMPDEYGNSEIVSAIIAMASSLNLLVVAEGADKLANTSFTGLSL